MNERIRILKEKMEQTTRFASVEQAAIITETYQNHEDQNPLMCRALALKAALEQMEIHVEPEELVVGNRSAGIRAGIVFPESGVEWVNREFETLPVREQDTFQVRPEDIAFFRDTIYPYWQERSLEAAIQKASQGRIASIAKVVKINQKDHAQGHICPDVKMWLELGPAGLIRKIQDQDRDSEWDRAAILTLEGAQTYFRRYAQAEEELGNDHMAAMLERLADEPAWDFHSAVQSLWMLFVILHMESNASSFSPGRMDQYLLPYYDPEKREEALEILECLWLKFNQIVYMRNQNSAKYFAGFPIGFNVAIGPADNELSWLMLQAQEDLLLPQPNLSVRLSEDTPSPFLQKTIEVLAKGSGMPQFFSDKAIIKPLEALGIDPADAENYAIVGCVELTTPGNSLGWSDAAMFNLVKVLELTFNHGKCLLTGEQLGLDLGGLDTYETYEQLEAAFAQMIDHFLVEMMACEEIVEKAHQDHLPTPFLSTVIHDCIERGVDVTAGGAKYNLSGIQVIQAANLADSLAAIKQLLYEEKRIGRQELLQALQDDFVGHEKVRATLLHRGAKYGNDVAWVDGLAAKWSGYVTDWLKGQTNYRGGPVHTGMYTVSAHVPMGENTGASADGRKAREPLADGGMSPHYGRDLSGPTAVLHSVSRLPVRCTTNGGLLNMKFLPDFFETEAGRQKFEQFLRAFAQLEIPHIQFNVVRREDLLDAKVHPERHRSLTVRVAGYTAYFTELAGKLQDEIIARTEYDHI